MDELSEALGPPWARKGPMDAWEIHWSAILRLHPRGAVIQALVGGRTG